MHSTPHRGSHYENSAHRDSATRGRPRPSKRTRPSHQPSRRTSSVGLPEDSETECPRKSQPPIPPAFVPGHTAPMPYPSPPPRRRAMPETALRLPLRTITRSGCKTEGANIQCRKTGNDCSTAERSGSGLTRGRMRDSHAPSQRRQSAQPRPDTSRSLHPTRRWSLVRRDRAAERRQPPGRKTEPACRRMPGAFVERENADLLLRLGPSDYALWLL